MTLTHHHVCKLDFFSFFSSSIPSTILYYSIFIILFFQFFGIFSGILILPLTWDMIRLRFVSKLVPSFTDICTSPSKSKLQGDSCARRKKDKPNETGTPTASILNAILVRWQCSVCEGTRGYENQEFPLHPNAIHRHNQAICDEGISFNCHVTR